MLPETDASDGEQVAHIVVQPTQTPAYLCQICAHQDRFLLSGVFQKRRKEEEKHLEERRLLRKMRGDLDQLHVVTAVVEEEAEQQQLRQERREVSGSLCLLACRFIYL